MRSLVRTSALLISLSFICAALGHAQIRFYASQPNIDSFPIVRIGVGVTVNAVAVTNLQATNFSVTSDGKLVPNLELVDCDAPLNAAIAIVVDTSASMKRSVGGGTPPNYSYRAFKESFSSLIGRVPKGSLFTVVPFGDSATYSYPRTSSFWNAGIDPDTSLLEDALNQLHFDSAGTYVDAGILYATQVLKTASVGRRAIVLVTDDYIDEESEITQLLQSNSISLYVMQVRPDSGIIIAPNRDVAIATAGGYFEAPDSNSYAPIMTTIAERIFSTRCTLRYRDTTDCPWLKTHNVLVGLNYNSTSLSAGLQFSLGPNVHDTTRPELRTDSSRDFNPTVLATKNYPCEAALRDGRSSALLNFRAGKTVVHDDSLWVPLVVIDTLYPADAEVTAVDKNGNEAHVHVHYEPRPDTVAPQFDSIEYVSGAYQLRVRECRAWDRGLKSLVLDPSATNVVLDLLKYYRKDSAWAVLHIHDLAQAVDACIIATDSAGNVNRLCFTYTPNAPDLLPPVLTADAVLSPRVRISGTVTEYRPNDSGIKDIVVAGGANASNMLAVPTSSRLYHVSASITDSLYSAVVYVRSTDSAGNEMRDSLVYRPVPDTIIPAVNYVSTSTVIDVTATDAAAWDRGLRSVTIASGATNANQIAGKYLDARHWTGSLLILDSTKETLFTVIATDSVGNVATVPVDIPGRTKQSAAYMGDSVIDFGTHFLPVAMRKSIVIRNTNSFAMTVSIPNPVGDDSVFSMVEPNVFPLSANNAEELNFDWFPESAGHWKLVYTLYSGADKIGTITLLGVSVATFKLSADTVAEYPGVTGKSLHIRVESIPSPLNVDTLSFRVHYNPNVVTASTPTACDGASTLCGYSLNVVPYFDGIGISLTRPARGPAVPLDYSQAVITIPIVTNVSSIQSTPVWFSDGYSNVGYIGDTANGQVTALDTCGTPMMRHMLQGAPILKILSVTPNPASGAIRASITSSVSELARVRWIDIMGKPIGTSTLKLEAGDHEYLLQSASSSGFYELEIALPGGAFTRWREQVIR
jgi:hypothetical protein